MEMERILDSQTACIINEISVEVKYLKGRSKTAVEALLLPRRLPQAVVTQAFLCTSMLRAWGDGSKALKLVSVHPEPNEDTKS